MNSTSCYLRRALTSLLNTSAYKIDKDICKLNIVGKFKYCWFIQRMVKQTFPLHSRTHKHSFWCALFKYLANGCNPWNCMLINKCRHQQTPIHRSYFWSSFLVASIFFETKLHEFMSSPNENVWYIDIKSVSEWCSILHHPMANHRKV